MDLQAFLKSSLIFIVKLISLQVHLIGHCGSCIPIYLSWHYLSCSVSLSLFFFFLIIFVFKPSETLILHFTFWYSSIWICSQKWTFWEGYRIVTWLGSWVTVGKIKSFYSSMSLCIREAWKTIYSEVITFFTE